MYLAPMFEFMKEKNSEEKEEEQLRDLLKLVTTHSQ